MSLVSTASSGWSTGFGNLLGKELGGWWGTRRWLIHLILWLVAVSGFVLAGTLAQYRTSTNPAGDVEELIQMFFQLGGFFGLIGAVLVTQNVVVGERESGTAAWVLTKPTTRSAFILSKFVALAPTFLLLSLVIPAVASFIMLKAFWGVAPAPAHFAEAVGILALHQAFYIALTLLLGVLLRSRAAVGGVALGFWISGAILPNTKYFAPLTPFLPWPLTDAATSIALWKPLPFQLWVPMLSTAILIVLFLGVALWAFEREEL
ncbi:MAG: ABC transporter permease subunit [Gemmatimonadales bacterium]|nr:ABC transporter permease subunit [Gemmatimonadales bacterium]